MSSRLDVLIVGGGPGGTAAAISCALHRMQACIIERQAFPRHRPGETLHPGIQPLMATLGVEDQLLSTGFVRHPGTWVAWDGELRFEAFGADEKGPWMGFQAWRENFDAMLLQRARQLGVEIQQPCRAVTPIVESNRVIGVQTSAGPIHAQFVIDAAGSGHWVARHLALGIERHSPELIAYYAYASSCRCPDDHLPMIVADSRGWTWTAKVRHDLYHCTRLAVGEDKFDRIDAMRRFIDISNPASCRGADVTWRKVLRAAGPGYFCVGDAACVLDPSSSHGILKAIMSGMMAAHVITQLLACPQDEIGLTSAYSRWLHNWFLHDVSHLRKLYSKVAFCPLSGLPGATGQ